MKPPKNDERPKATWQKELGERISESTSASQKATAANRAALRAALSKLSEDNKSSVSEALKNLTATPSIDKPNTALRTAIYNAAKKAQSPPKAQGLNASWAKTSQRHSAFHAKDLASTIQQIAEAQKVSKPVPTVNRLIGLKSSSVPSSSTDAHKKAFQAGFNRGLKEAGSLDLNPWVEQVELFSSPSAADALREDWMLIESDLWETVEKMAHQLEKLPPQSRVRLAKLLARYLRSHSGS